MTKSSVKPASRIHGRDDNNWKEEIMDSQDVTVHDGHIISENLNQNETEYIFLMILIFF